MLEAFVIGVFAGYAIAIPVGPIAVLILRTGMREGLRAAMAAGAGTATADLLYFSLAMVAGPTLVAAIHPVLMPARLSRPRCCSAWPRASYGTWTSPALPGNRAVQKGRTPRCSRSRWSTLRRSSNFASLTIGLPTVSSEPAARALFAIGAGLSSLSWQWVLAGGGAALHGRVPQRLGLWTGIASSAIIAVLAGRIALDALAS